MPERGEGKGEGWDPGSELVMGLRAKGRLATLPIPGAWRSSLMGRTATGALWPASTSVARISGVQEGLALPWQDGPEARVDRLRHWCG